MLRGYFLASQEWSLSVVCGKHNHELAKTLEGHIFAGCLKPEEKECIHELTRIRKVALSETRIQKTLISDRRIQMIAISNHII
jgi:hypothetical protein